MAFADRVRPHYRNVNYGAAMAGRPRSSTSPQHVQRDKNGCSDPGARPMIMGIAKRRRAAGLGPGRGKVAGANSMTLLGDEGSAPAITVLLVEDDAPTSWRLQDALS